MSKTVYSFHPGTGAYIAAQVLDDGDLSPLEDGVYLIPGGCLEAAPPACPDGFWPFATAGAWELRELPKDPDPETPPEPTFEERAAALLGAVDRRMDAAARAKGYDNRNTFYMRAAVPGSPFHAEGLVFATWMDATYALCYHLMAQVKAGDIDEPNEAQLIAMLPTLNLPDSKGA